MLSCQETLAKREEQSSVAQSAAVASGFYLGGQLGKALTRETHPSYSFIITLWLFNIAMENHHV
jgi:hypothetical protein